MSGLCSECRSKGMAVQMTRSARMWRLFLLRSAFTTCAQLRRHGHLPRPDVPQWQLADSWAEVVDTESGKNRCDICVLIDLETTVAPARHPAQSPNAGCPTHQGSPARPVGGAWQGLTCILSMTMAGRCVVACEGSSCKVNSGMGIILWFYSQLRP